MPSPFPGMNPYLEDIWPRVHHDLITYLSAELNRVLPPSFFSSTEERMRIIAPERDFQPDVNIRRPGANGTHTRPGFSSTQQRNEAGDGVVTLEPPILIEIPHYEEREGFIEIRFIRDGSEQVVTVVELLSPSNKSNGSKGRDEYLQKQKNLLQSESVNLVEIDLLRAGLYTFPMSKEQTLERGAWDYGVSVHRAIHSWQYAFYPITARQRLPQILVPLTVDVLDVVLDIQEAFDRCYEDGAYERRVDYRREPVPPLSEEDANWTDALLRERRLR